MRLLGNLLWIILGGGIFIFLGYFIGGIVLCLTIVGIPFGLQLFKLSLLGLAPFGKEIVSGSRPVGCLGLAMNILWIIFGGWEVALTHLIFGLLCAITIIGLPFARQHMKLATMSLVPFGSRVVDA